MKKSLWHKQLGKTKKASFNTLKLAFMY